MGRDVEIKPSFEKGIPVGLCTKECKAMRRADKAGEVIITCRLGAKDAEVIPRPVCMPWVSERLKEISSLTDDIASALDERDQAVRRAEIAESKAESMADTMKDAVGEAVKVKGEFSALKMETSALRVKLASAEKRAHDADEEKHAMWQKLKDVQVYISEREKHKTRVDVMAKKLTSMEELAKKNDSLEFEIRRIKSERDNLLLKVEKLTQHAQEIEKKLRDKNLKKFEDAEVHTPGVIQDGSDRKDGVETEQ